MTNEALLTLLKLDLQNPPDVLDSYLLTLIGAAKERITSYGIALDMGAYSDIHLVIQYASYLYRLRNSSDGMPRSLQFALHSRLVNEKGGDGHDAG